jgi:hypothetical protein
MSALLELAAHCEAAEGGDTVLDKAIAQALGWRLVVQQHDDGVSDYDWKSPEGAVCPWYPSFTRSIGAALTLKEGIGVLITLSEIKGDGMPHCVIGNPATAELFEAVAATPALAICAAALRARDTIAKQGGQP